MPEETRILLANCAGSFFLFLIFLIVAAGVVVLAMAWRGLKTVRRELHPLVARLEHYVREAEAATHATAEAVVEPQVQVQAAWAGVKAGARALFARPRPSKPPTRDPTGDPTDRAGTGGTPN